MVNVNAGDRFNTGDRKMGTAHHHDEYSLWPVARINRAYPAKLRNRTTSVPKGIIISGSPLHLLIVCVFIMH